MGALEHAPATAGFETSSSVQIDSLYQLAKKLFQEREKAIVLSGEALNLQSLYEVGTSAGGQHPKAIIAINRETGDIRSGVSDRLTPSINFQYAFLSLPAKRILWYIGH